MIHLLLRRGARLVDAGNDKYAAPYELQPEEIRSTGFCPHFGGPAFLDASDMEVLHQLGGLGFP